MVRLMYARSLAPREPSISQRIASSAARERLDVRVAQMGVFRYVVDRHGVSVHFGHGGARRPRAEAQVGKVYEPRHGG